jgi:putative endonuclease
MLFYFYIIYSETNHLYYKGFTECIENRLATQNSNKSRYTARKGPWVIVYLERLRSKSEALIREKTLKKYQHTRIVELIKSPKNILNNNNS